MAKFCTNCGAELRDGAVFCTECGTRVPAAEPQPEPVPETLPEPQPESLPISAPVPAPEPAPAPAPVYQAQEQRQEQNQYQNPYQNQEPYPPTYPPQPPAKEPRAVSTIGFMLLQLLYAIPIVGFISSLVLAIAPRNKNLRHHALANFLWKIIFLVLFIFGCIRLKAKADVFWDQMNQSIIQNGGQGIHSLDDLLQSLQDGSLEQIIGQYAQEYN